MDPGGPWSAYASYNRLAGVQAGATGSDFHHHHGTGHTAGAGVPSTTSQLLLQAAHTTASLASSTASAFNPGSFLSPPPVSYDAVFSPLFHHAANNKQAHYVNQHRQALQAAASKQSAGENEHYPSHHQAPPQGFFEQGNAASAAWQQNSPFGVLPHESVVPNSPGNVATTKGSTAYENFNAHFAAAQSLNHLNSQLAAVSAKTSRSQSPQVSAPSASSKSPAPNSSFFQVPTTFGTTESLSTFTATSKQQEYNSSNSTSSSKSFQNTANSNSSMHQSQQSCIVSSPSPSSQSTPPTSKEYRIPQAPLRSTLFPGRSEKAANRQQPAAAQQPASFAAPPVKPQPPPAPSQQIQTKAQTKVYPELSSQANDRAPRNSTSPSQSSPISFSMDAPGRQHYAGSNSSAKGRGYQLPNSGTYRHYQPGANPDGEYNRASNKQSSGTPEYQNSNGPDCGVVVPRRPSPLQAHSQASPLGHVPSPAYPMYNSPLNSISSPQQQVAPPSPLDASVPRPPSQQQQQSVGGIAYPSVITRAQQTPNQPTQQNCWEDRQQQQQHTQRSKYPTATNYPTNSLDLPNNRQVDLPTNQNTHQNNSNPQAQQRAALGISERQQAYFDSNTTHQVTLQDLSSCRGDPMTIVKNLQTLQQQQQAHHQAQAVQQAHTQAAAAAAAAQQAQAAQAAAVAQQNHQQSCQIQQQAEIKQELKGGSGGSGGSKRRKSNDKGGGGHPNPISELTGAAMAEYFTSRIPPPAHSSAASQQQQNGATYFDFERWNLPPPPPKMFTGSPAFGAQAMQQHQSLMVPHPHHPPPPIPYFPAFHLPPHHSEYSSSSVENSIPNYNHDSSSTNHHSNTNHLHNSHYHHPPPPVNPPEAQPKVVVPNIEEELNFLSENNPRRGQANPATQPAGISSHIAPHPPPAVMKLPEKKVSGPGAGFMNSYLKFLQGERDSSPPPAGRGGRKTSWQRKPEPNGTTVPATPVVLPPPPPPVPQPAVRLSSQGDPQDDPRYFPLPKERKHRLDSSSDGFDSSDDDLPGFRPKQSHTSQQSETSSQSFLSSSSKERLHNTLSSGRKGRQSKPGPPERKRGKSTFDSAKNKTPPNQQRKPDGG